MERPAIEVDNVSKRFRLYRERAGSLKEAITTRRVARYEEFWALRDVSLSVAPGEVYGLVGHNGSGKSSLLRLIAGIHQPTSGKVATRGRISALLELGAGFHPDLSGRENVYLNAAILGISRRECDELIDDIIDFSGLAEFIDSPVRHYSSGMYVRLGFAVAVKVQPQILIVDEVIAVGDEEFQRKCFDHLARLRKEGVTILMVSHGLDLIRTMCDRAAWLDHGHLVTEGPAGEVVDAYLASVNDAESLRLEGEARAGAAEDKPDGGTPGRGRGGLSVTGVEFLDDAGHPVHGIPARSALTIRVRYRCDDPVTDPQFSFVMDDDRGNRVAGARMDSHERTGLTLTGEGAVDYHLERLPVAPGSYHVSVRVHDPASGDRLDERVHLGTLVVQPSGPGIDGMVDLGGQWGPPHGDTSRD